jgi:hypothetical protein
MTTRRPACLLLACLLTACGTARTTSEAPARQTTVSIVGEDFQINGQPTYPGRTWNGHRIEGRLMNSRMVQGVFDDLNPETAPRWAYADTGTWDAERNVREFIAAMPAWRAHGLLAAHAAHPRCRRSARHGGDPWLLLLRPGRSPARRRRCEPQPLMTPPTGYSPAAGATC